MPSQSELVTNVEEAYEMALGEENQRQAIINHIVQNGQYQPGFLDELAPNLPFKVQVQAFKQGLAQHEQMSQSQSVE